MSAASALYAERRRNLECVDCEDEPMPGRARCAACARRKADSAQAARLRRIAAGTCSRCTEAPVEGSEFCTDHLIAHRDSSAAYWDRRHS